MNHYLVVFDRSKGVVIHRQSYADPGIALDARFAAEREHRSNPDIEVVVLGADSWDALKRTHGRYFKDFSQIAASARS
jgi:hypothetical protein